MKRKLVDAYYLAHEAEMDDYVFQSQEFKKRHEEIYEKCDQLCEMIKPLGKDAWRILDQIIGLYNIDESECCRKMYIKGFTDYERLVIKK